MTITGNPRKRVLILGDSISMGYTPFVRGLLEDVAEVHRPADNCASTQYGLENIDAWIGAHRWDVVSFNWGLHDLCYRHPDSTLPGNRDKIRGTIIVPIEQYRENLEQLVQRLRPAADHLLWVSTTLVPNDEPGRYVGDDIKYNGVASQIMARYGIPTCDLHAVSRNMPPSAFVQPRDVHYTPAGYEELAGHVATAIRALL